MIRNWKLSYLNLGNNCPNAERYSSGKIVQNKNKIRENCTICVIAEKISRKIGDFLSLSIWRKENGCFFISKYMKAKQSESKTPCLKKQKDVRRKQHFSKYSKKFFDIPDMEKKILWVAMKPKKKRTYDNQHFTLSYKKFLTIFRIRGKDYSQKKWKQNPTEIRENRVYWNFFIGLVKKAEVLEMKINRNRQR